MSTQALRAAVAPATDQEKPKTIRDILKDPRVQSGLKAVGQRYLTPDRMTQLVINACDRTPKLLQCTPRSVLGAVMLSQAFQLEPNTPQQLAFLIPYNRNIKVGGQWQTITECQFQIGARGFRLLAHRSGRFSRIVARTVRKGDLFEYMEGSDTFLKYQMALEKPRGDVIAAFSYAVWKEGGEEALVLPLSEIEKIRSKSETYRALTTNLLAATSDKEKAKAQKAFDEQPWVMWFDDMCAKSATKKHAKEWPIDANDPVQTAATVDDAADAGTINMDSFADPEQTRAVVEGGDEPPQLENDPSPTLEETVKPQGEKVPVQQEEKKPEQEAKK